MEFIIKYVNRRSQDGAVGGPGYCGSIPGRGKRSISSSKDQSGSGTHPVSAPFAGGKAAGA